MRICVRYALVKPAASPEMSLDHSLDAPADLSLVYTWAKSHIKKSAYVHLRFVQRKILRHGKKPFTYPHFQTGATFPPPKSFRILQHPRQLLFCSTDTKASYMLHQTALQSDMAQAQAFWLSTLVQSGVMQMHTSCLVTM